MADTAKIWPIFRWANWWLSDDLFTGIKNSFYFSNDMEIRQDAKSAYPKPVPAYADVNTRIAVWDWSTNDLAAAPRCVFYSDEDVGRIVCGMYNIYKVADNGTVTLLCTMNEKICDAEMFNKHIYVATRDYLYYKIDNGWNWADMASATDDSVANYGRCTQSLTNNLNHPLYASDVCLCVWDTHNMRYVSQEIPTLMQLWFKIQEGYYIRFINELWWFVRAVAVDEPYGSEVLLWDKVSDVPDEIIPLEWFSILETTLSIFCGLTFKTSITLNSFCLSFIIRLDAKTELENCLKYPKSWGLYDLCRISKKSSKVWAEKPSIVASSIMECSKVLPCFCTKVFQCSSRFLCSSLEHRNW